ncbi:TPR domain protein [Aspergillus steynii IBT 23096]|uniref:TPR domain protein n=1 Tax=Aspergillus steynii IBT 23096 TaxID=1392250 RepID=A0A2I2GBS5_9EURO|nr:TPR domain protein [Aspergillus steynii IBT 23096]PLB50329.1 TPR domain protein [Aspergillus steynii IBT 23096]
MFTATSRRACALTPKTRFLQHNQPATRRTISHIHPRTRPNGLASRSRLPTLPLGASQQQTRSLSFMQRMKLGFREASKGIWRKNPVLLPLALFSTAGATLLFTYIAYVEYTSVGPQFHKFPPPVVRSLRTAVYYTEVDLNPPKALKAYKDALHIAVEMGMHPFSDEVLGIKLQVAMMLEKAGLAKPAVDVLERTKREVLAWIEEGRKKEAEEVKMKTEAEKKGQGKKDDAAATVDATVTDPEILEEQRRIQELEAYEHTQRDKALKKAVGIEMKLAELYSSDYIQDDAKGEAAQVAAVELCLEEMRRRQSLGMPVGGGTENNDAWLNLTEIATALSDLASRYTEQEKHELAMPLYLRALDLLRVDEGKQPTCKQVVLLNDVASAMAGQAQKPIRAADPSAARNQIIDAAKQWAQKSIDVAARIQPPVRDQDCDVSCVAATYNLGELAELQNKPKDAEKFYKQAKSLAQGLQFEEGIAMADGALERVTKK